MNITNKLPNGYDEIIAAYGNPHASSGGLDETWYAQNIVRFTPPYQLFYQDGKTMIPEATIAIHAKAVEDLRAIMIEIYEYARIMVKHNDGNGLTSMYYNKRTLEVLSNYRCNAFSGSFNYRDKRNQPGVPSVHSFGVAIDFDAEHNAFGSQRGTLPNWFIDAFKSHGWEWGGDWHGANKDWMHFQRCTGY